MELCSSEPEAEPLEQDEPRDVADADVDAAGAALREWGVRAPEFAVQGRVRKFIRDGGTLNTLRALRARADIESDRPDPLGLLWDWLVDAPTWRSVLLTINGAEKEAENRKRARSVSTEDVERAEARSAGDVLTEITDPMFGEVGG